MKLIVKGTLFSEDGKIPPNCPPFYVFPELPSDPCPSFQFCYTNNISLDVCPEFIRITSINDV